MPRSPRCRVSPSPSPDERLLAFRGYFGFAEGDYAIYTVRANGCQVRRVPNTLQGFEPSWSPTRRQIALVKAGQAGIEIINADGTNLRQLIPGTHPGSDSSPSWSARNVIAFVRARGSRPGQIYTVKPDGRGLTQITTAPDSAPRAGHRPAASSHRSPLPPPSRSCTPMAAAPTHSARELPEADRKWMTHMPEPISNVSIHGLLD